MNSKISLPPISDILNNNGTKLVEQPVRAYVPSPVPHQTYQYSNAPVLVQQMPVQHSPQGIPIQNGSMIAGPTMMAASPMAVTQNQMYPMVPMPSYRLISPNYNVGEASQLQNSAFTYRYTMAMPPQQHLHHQAVPAPGIYSAPAVVGSGLRALIVSELSTKPSTPASPTSIEKSNRMTPDRVSETVHGPSPPSPVVRSRTRNNLPKETTYILLKWLEEHLNHPYPNSFEKTQLMFSTGLNQQQLSNWFINARRRKIRAMKQRQKV